MDTADVSPCRALPGGYIQKLASSGSGLERSVIDRMCKGNGTTVEPWNHSSKGAPQELNTIFLKKKNPKVNLDFKGVLRGSKPKRMRKP